MKKYYAIKSESAKVVVDSWDECKKLIEEMKNPKYKSFLTIEEANAFLDDIILDDKINEPKAYIDGSFDSNTNSYSFGGVLIVDNKEYKFKKAYQADEFSKYRNVAGEIKGAAYIINHSINLGIKRLHIFYDYEGIEKWFLGIWKANTDISKKYQEYANSINGKIDVIFHKVKGHSNNHYNEMADELAKEALNIKK